MKVLIRNGANVNDKNEIGRTPLMRAALSGNWKSTQFQVQQ